jgi:epoxyqueuosine reductase
VSAHELAARVKARATELGFDLVGIAPAVPAPGYPKFLDWLAAGHHAGMEYLSRRAPAYAHPNGVLDGTRSVVMLGINHAPQSGTGSARVARYALGERDYHDVLRDKLAALCDWMRTESPGCRARGIVDTAPLLERDFARLAGLGWIGKNTLLINKHRGSWLFLAAVLTDVDLEPDAPHTASHCGTCTRCLDACPTDAFPEPGVLDARKCIAYWTIEHRGPIAPEIRPDIGDWLFGCDVCQEVCPWNRREIATSERAFVPVETLSQLDPVELLKLDDAAFRAKFRGTPLSRPGRSGLLRNACVVLGNRGGAEAERALTSAVEDIDPVVRDAAAWGLGRIGGSTASC